LIEHVRKRIRNTSLPEPLFVVVQTGTKVMEMSNVGDFNTAQRRETAAEKIKKLVSICRRERMMIKAHNGDYMSDESLREFGKLGVGGINIAPEMGVVETRTLLDLFKRCGLTSSRDQFIRLAVDSEKWKKWIAPDSRITDMDRALIAGHYVYSTKPFLELKSELAVHLEKQGESLDQLLKNEVKRAIRRYIELLRSS